MSNEEDRKCINARVPVDSQLSVGQCFSVKQENPVNHLHTSTVTSLVCLESFLINVIRNTIIELLEDYRGYHYTNYLITNKKNCKNNVQL